MIAKLKGIIITIDAGHGGKDPGAVDGKNIKEKDVLLTEEEDLVLAMALQLKDKLSKHGAKVIMTREKDIYPSLQERCDKAKKSNSKLFISIHLNAATSNVASGCETLFKAGNAKGQKLASYIQNELISATGAKDRGIKARDELYVLNGTPNIASVIIEPGFITNPSEERKLNSKQYQDLITTAILKGISLYL